MIELVVRKGFLTALLNQGIRTERSSIVVNSPFLDLDLMGVNLDKPSIDWIVERGKFDAAYSEVQTKIADPILGHEIPSYSDLKDALESSLLLPPENLKDVEAELRKIDTRRAGSSLHPMRTMVAIDTNLAYHRLMSRLPLASDACGIPEFDATRLQLVIENLVEREISERVGKKYRETDLEIMRRAFKSPRVVGALTNCLMKDGRKALNAQTEMAAIRARYATWDVSGGEWNEDKEKRDGEIIRSLFNHAKAENVGMLFLSADDKASASASAAHLPTIILRYGHEVPSTVVYDPWLFVEFLYDLSIMYGVIGISGLGVRIYGDWAGKRADDYHAEKVRLEFEDSSPLAAELSRQNEVCERLRHEIDLSVIE
ncbi:MAG TPA: hypothetical protein VMS79_02270 [Methanomassiliicoccales archaeon]|nr:hypothetical protein [Methanomassiliicoccales archaeon]